MPATRALDSLLMAGVVLLFAAGVSAELALVHMRETAALYGVICGQGPSAPGHCAACYVAAFTGLMGFAALALRESLSRRVARAKVRA